MGEAIDPVAAVQYGDMSGTVALDEADFVQLNKLLGMPDREIVIGIELDAFHPGLQAKVAADSSYTYLTTYPYDLDDLPTGTSLPELVDAGQPLQVTKRSNHTTDLDYGGSPGDALSLLAQASKRLSLKVWHRSVNPELIEIVHELSYQQNPETGLWVEASWGTLGTVRITV